MIELPCFYSLSSPWAYFMGPQLEDIVRRHKVRLVLKPFDFQEIVPRTGGVPLRTRPPARRSYHEEELDRWRRYLQMPLALKPRYYPEKVADPDWNKRPGWMVIADTLLTRHPSPSRWCISGSTTGWTGICAYRLPSASRL